MLIMLLLIVSLHPQLYMVLLIEHLISIISLHPEQLIWIINQWVIIWYILWLFIINIDIF